MQGVVRLMSASTSSHSYQQEVAAFLLVDRNRDWQLTIASCHCEHSYCNRVSFQVAAIVAGNLCCCNFGLAILVQVRIAAAYTSAEDDRPWTDWKASSTCHNQGQIQARTEGQNTSDEKVLEQV